MDTSIIILSYNTKDYTRRCIQSIRTYTKPGTYEIIVVENGSSDGSVNWLLAQPDIRLLVNDENVGFPKGCNQGMRIAQGRELLLLNSDIIVTPRWLEQLRLGLYSAPDVGAVGCMTNACGGDSQKLNVPYGDNLDDMQIFAEKYNHTNASSWCKRLILLGFCFLFRRKVYETVGELDEGFTPGSYEDDDYSLRIREAGWTLLLCKDTFVHHFGSGSFLSSNTPADYREKVRCFNELLSRNRKRFLDKWRLSEKYKISYLSVLSVMKVECFIDAPKIMLMNGGVGEEAYILQEHYPQAEISLIVGNTDDARFMDMDFKAKYCKDVERDGVSLMEGEYDCVICIEPLDGYRDTEVFLRRVSEHLSQCGWVAYIAGGEIQVRRF